LPCGNFTICHAQVVARLRAQPFDQRQTPAHPTLVPSQQLRHFHLAHAVFAHQSMNDPGFFEFARAAAGTIESVNGGFHGALVGFHQAGGKVADLHQVAGGSQTFESVD
jgi:hypothetical protein